MDGRGRVVDNIFTERLWRSVKYEEFYLHDYASPWKARQSTSTTLSAPTRRWITAPRQSSTTRATQPNCYSQKGGVWLKPMSFRVQRFLSTQKRAKQLPSKRTQAEFKRGVTSATKSIKLERKMKWKMNIWKPLCRP